MIRVLSVVGFHRAGKTKVVEAVVRELSKRGYRVGTVKHITESEFTVDRPGKDSWLHAQAGARQVVLLAPKEVAKIEKRSAQLEEILKSLTGLDFVIVEGFKEYHGLAKIVVAKNKAELSELKDEFTIACVGAEGPPVPSFDFGQLERIVDMVEQKAYPLLSGLDCKRCGVGSCREYALAVVSGDKRWGDCPVFRSGLTITIGGERVPLKPFAQEIFEGTIKGMVSALKGAKDGQIEIRVTKDD